MASEERINIDKVTQDGVQDDDDLNKDNIGHLDVSSRSSRYSDPDDNSMFEPDLDYEPEDGDDDEEQEGKNETPADSMKHSDDLEENMKSKSRTDRSKRSYLSSDDDDIEVIGVINSETVSPKEAKSNEDRKEHTRSMMDLEKRRSRSRSSRRRGLSRYRSQERNCSRSRKSIKGEKSPENDMKRSESSQRDSNQEIKYNEYSLEDLEKLKAFFAGAQNKRKVSESHGNKIPAKKFKGNDGRGLKDSKEDWLKEKLEREGKVFIRNYIPFPSSKKSNFERDIQIAFKDELNGDILTTLTPTYCGLCFKDFDDEVVAWKHYTGSNHKGTIKRFNKGTYKGHPPFWRMVHERLCDKDPGALTEREIFDQVCDTYNVGDNRDKVKSLVKRNIDCLMQYDQVGIRDDAYFIKNKNVQEVGKIFENYFYEKKKNEELEHKKKLNRYGVNAPTRRNYEESSSSNHRMSYAYDPRSVSTSRYPEDRRVLPSRHSSSSKYQKGDGRNPANQMLVVDPSKLRTLPNGQIMIKQDDVMSMRDL